MTASTVNAVKSTGPFKAFQDKSKPGDIRGSNINAAKGIWIV